MIYIIERGVLLLICNALGVSKIVMEISSSLDNLDSARQLLKISLEKSRDIANAIDETGPRLEESKERLASLQETIVKNVSCKCALYDIKRHVDRAIGPAAAVLRIFEVVLELENSFPDDPSSDLYGYLSAIQRIEEASRLLSDNCKLVILWLQEALRLFNEDNHEDDWYFQNVMKCLNILMQIEETERRLSFDGGLLSEAVNKIKGEFRRLLSEISLPLPPRLADSSFSSIVENLNAIVERLTYSNGLQECLSIYVEVRSSVIQTALQAHDLSYLEMSLSEFDSIQNVEAYIDQWDEHLQFAVRYLFEMEYWLCKEMFQITGCDVWMDCFPEIVLRSGGFVNFIGFGNTVVEGKREAVKLLKLLDIFAALFRLRPDFNRLFSGKACHEIQSLTRDLMKKIINGACEIFWDLCVQVESKRSSSHPPVDGSVPKLVVYVTEYCNLLLEDEYRSILVQVLEIHQGWNNRKFDDGLLYGQIQNMIKTLEINLETWAETYQEAAVSHLFLMNNCWYLCKNIKGTKLGDLMGEKWLNGYEESAEDHAAAYLSESWGKLSALLSEEDLTLYPGGRAIKRELVQKRLEEFNKAFDEMYRKQSNWVLSDKGLRMKMSQLIVQSIIPFYKSYIQKYVPLLMEEDENGSTKCNSPESLEKMIGSLFQHKLGSAKCTPLAGEIENLVANHMHPTSAAA